MALTTPAPAGTGVARCDLVALVCAGSAGVHGALVVPHVEESGAMAVAFGLSTVLLAVAAVGMALDPTRPVAYAVAALLAGVAAAYLLARTTGLPGLTDHPEPFDAVGTVVSVLEVAGAVLVVLHLNPRRD